LTFFLVLSVTVHGQSQTNKSGSKSQDIWGKTISYHDPNGVWNKFKGTMHEVTVYANHDIVNERIEINNPDDYYLSTISAKIGIIKRGMDKGKYFYSFDNNFNVPDMIRKEYSLSVSSIAGFREQHIGHFGLPMHLKATGMQIQRKTKTVVFAGRKCYELTFIGRPDQVVSNYYIGKLILYIDKETWAMHGLRWEREGRPATYVIYNEEIVINGIKIPHIQSSYFVENNINRYTAVNNPQNE